LALHDAIDVGQLLPSTGVVSGSVAMVIFVSAGSCVQAPESWSSIRLRASRPRTPAQLMELMELMRYESIETTLSYYVGRNAERTAKILWDEDQKAARPDAMPTDPAARITP
jgi:hypothetical protein